MVRSGESVININTGPDCIYYSFPVSLFPSGCCGQQCLNITEVSKAEDQSLPTTVRSV